MSLRRQNNIILVYLGGYRNTLTTLGAAENSQQQQPFYHDHCPRSFVFQSITADPSSLPVRSLLLVLVCTWLSSQLSGNQVRVLRCELRQGRDRLQRRNQGKPNSK